MNRIATWIMTALIALSAGNAFASIGVISGNSGLGPLMWAFFAFTALIVIYKALPTIVVFFGILKGLFSTDPTENSFSPWKGRNR